MPGFGGTHSFGGEDRARIPAAGVAGWVAVMAGAAAMSAQLIASGPPLEIVLPAMLTVHALIGIGEALITMAALAFIAATRADLFRLRDAGGPIDPGRIVAGSA